MRDDLLEFTYREQCSGTGSIYAVRWDADGELTRWMILPRPLGTRGRRGFFVAPASQADLASLEVLDAARTLDGRVARTQAGNR